MPGNENYNVVVIGGGTAGLVTAAGTAGLGGRVALVEKDRMGGECLNTGCVPSKALIASARLIEQIRHAEDWGLRPQTPEFEFQDVFARMRARRARIAPHDSEERFRSLGVDVIRGEARFVSPNEVRVGEIALRAKHFVIATGARPAVPPIEGLDAVRNYTNETIFDALEGKPDRLVVVGGGPVGCELSQVFARLGVAVTVVQRAPRLLPREDADASSLLRRRFEGEGVTVLLGASVTRARTDADSIRLSLDGGSGPREIACDTLLIAAGKVPNIDRLNLEAAGVAYTAKGVKTNAHLQTSQPHIYAAGDVVGEHHFTHVADHHARIVVRNILLPWPKASVERHVVPWCTFTSPEVARVGLNEDEANRNGIAYERFVQPLEEVDRAVLEGEEVGFAKVLTPPGKDRILGVTLVCERAGDLLAEFAAAMKHGIGLGGIGRVIHTYPTFAEIARKLADQRQRARLTPFVKGVLIRLYRWRRR